MTEQEIIRDICKKEDDSVLYDINIGGVPVYSMIRGFVRYQIIESYNLPVMKLRSPLNGLAAFIATFISLWHLLKLLGGNKKYPTVYYAFSRVDRVGDYYLDKFTDPIIEQCEKKGKYIILDHGRAGVHPKPRVHSDSLVFLDLFSVLSKLYGLLFYKFYFYRHKRKFALLFKELKNSFGLDFNKSVIIRELVTNVMYVSLLQRIFKKISAERVIGPARAFMSAPFIAAKRQGMKTFELQHGITYEETVLYSGYRDEMIVPDYFLAFGNNNPLDVYGIDKTRIVNIGWAFQDYIANLSYVKKYGPRDVLVVSDPEVTIPMLNAVIRLAKDNPECAFYFRPHPHEEVTQKHIKMIAPYSNIKIQNNRINITIALQKFSLIVGENSTVVYEALAIRKKVGRLFFEGLNPIYTDGSDRDCFWEIRDQKDFIIFVEGDVNSKRSKSIYSSFNKKRYLEITGISE